jgi:hypothetical protein
MKKNIFILCLLASLPAVAQETYENANIMTEDLNGTARYVGLGGAMEALGADISTMGSNPAGIGLMRRSVVNASASVVSQQDAENFDFAKKTKLSFDQAGFVVTQRMNERSFLNFGFNYHKNRNFSHILNASNKLNGASQHKLSYIKGYEGVFYPDFNEDNEVIGYENETSSYASNTFNQLDYLYYNAVMTESDNRFYYEDALSYVMNRGNKGYIGEYDFNISGNIKDRVYLGLTVGVKDVRYKNYSEYEESYAEGGSILITDDRQIKGTGFDIKAGVIFRPIEASAFRVGLYVNTPTWYSLTTDNYTYLYNRTKFGLYDNGESDEAYDFKLYTPWKFGASIGHTIGNYLALGATYEFSDYSAADTRIITGQDYDWYYDSYTDRTDADRDMNDHTSSTLKGVSTLKLGLEYRPVEDIAVRCGYNYVSPMYKKDGFKDGTLISPGSYYASTTDYTNWKDTHRLTLGLGYNTGNFSLDVAYQYNVQKGDFSPFMCYYAAPGAVDVTDNVVEPVQVSNKHHQLLLTLGYRF